LPNNAANENKPENVIYPEFETETKKVGSTVFRRCWTTPGFDYDFGLKTTTSTFGSRTSNLIDSKVSKFDSKVSKFGSNREPSG
jgi:hypothetical protein